MPGPQLDPSDATGGADPQVPGPTGPATTPTRRGATSERARSRRPRRSSVRPPTCACSAPVTPSTPCATPMGPCSTSPASPSSPSWTSNEDGSGLPVVRRTATLRRTCRHTAVRWPTWVRSPTSPWPEPHRPAPRVGMGNRILGAGVSRLELIGADGELRAISRGEPDFDGSVVALAALGRSCRSTWTSSRRTTCARTSMRTCAGARWSSRSTRSWDRPTASALRPVERRGPHRGARQVPRHRRP